MGSYYNDPVINQPRFGFVSLLKLANLSREFAWEMFRGSRFQPHVRWRLGERGLGAIRDDVFSDPK